MARLAALVLLLAAAPAAAAPALEFEEEVPRRTLSVGPVQPGTATVSADVGWLRSGLRADLGLVSWLDVYVFGHAFLLHERLDGQQGIGGGLRVTPLTDPFRLSLSADVGVTLVDGATVDEQLIPFRFEAALGVPLDLFGAPRLGMPFLRGQVRVISYDLGRERGSGTDGEVGGGWELAFGRLLVAGEVFAWLRPGLSALTQWRLRVGHAF